MPRVWRVLDRHAVRSLDDYITGGGGEASRIARSSSPEDLVGVVEASGLRGRGGAGFPTGTKWQTVAASRSSQVDTTVVVNAAEGEPGTFKDRALLRTNPYRVIEGALVAAAAMRTHRIRIGIKASFGREIDRLNAAIVEMRTAGWLDGVDIDLILGPSSYLFGEETGLLEVLEGRQPFPRVTPPYRRGIEADDTRSAAGVDLATVGGSDEPPALVDNVETLANVSLLVEHGPEWFREVGTERSPGTIVCTVSGATRRSGVGEVPMGATLREVIALIGWGPRHGRQINVVLAGTASALIPARLLDTPLTYEAMQDAGTGLGSAGFIVFDDTTDPAAIAAGVARFLAVESCGQCEPCKTDGLFIADTLQRSLQQQPSEADLATLRRRIDTVATGARCNLARQQAAVTGSLLVLFPDALRTDPHLAPLNTEPVAIAPIADLIGGRVILDRQQLTKQPDWSHDGTDSGAAPAARLGNTPVQVAAANRTRHWPEWVPHIETDHPLQLIDDTHDAIDAQIHTALDADPPARAEALRDVALSIRTHIDVTRRILYPMVRRVAGEAGDVLADAAEDQERALIQLLDVVNAEEPHSALRDISDAMQTHADLDDQILELLRSRLAPDERSSLADGLAAARSTSTVTNEQSTASKTVGS